MDARSQEDKPLPKFEAKFLTRFTSRRNSSFVSGEPVTFTLTECQILNKNNAFFTYVQQHRGKIADKGLLEYRTNHACVGTMKTDNDCFTENVKYFSRVIRRYCMVFHGNCQNRNRHMWYKLIGTMWYVKGCGNSDICSNYFDGSSNL
ncbi:hypothetical protein AVEN_41901-1 [Araneus ventricosus]|uniref:Uncharacterized protein n=1 Tax=Araneus ventricosus TaxID=182803 RepID=A0A4Y2ACD9_ARAVE|nr:hypothetical protein AVEN_41901-1 [Araneus ventricosus]